MLFAKVLFCSFADSLVRYCFARKKQKIPAVKKFFVKMRIVLKAIFSGGKIMPGG